MSQDRTPSRISGHSPRQDGLPTVDDKHPPIQLADLQTVYEEIAEDIASYEQQLSSELPIETPYGLSDCLTEQQARWESGVKSLRSLPVLNTYETVLEESVVGYTDLKRLLVCLDATINILDDIIDTADADHSQRIAHSVNVAFAQIVSTTNIPQTHFDQITDLLFEYLIEIFQIPRVENKLLTQFDQTDQKATQRRLEIAESIYTYRAHAISAFARIPAIVLDVESGLSDRLVEDLEVLRARQLIYKDLADIKRDIRDNDHTVILSLLNTPERDPHQVATFIESLHNQFTYSQTSKENYRSILAMFEGRPSDIESELRERMEQIN